MLNNLRVFADSAARAAFLADNRTAAISARFADGARDLSFALVTSRPEFDALEADWNDLFARTGLSIHAFQTFAWNWHWANTYLDTSPSVELAVVTVRRRGQLVVLWPLVLERTAGLRILAWMGAPVSQYGDILAERGPALLPALRESFAFAIEATRADVVRLNKTRSDAVVAPFLTEIAAPITQRQQAPFLDLASAPTWEAYEARYSASGRKKNRRRQLRRLEEQGAVEVVTWSEAPTSAEPALRAVATKRAWLTARCLVSPAVSDERFGKFFMAAAASVDRPVGLRIAALLCGGDTAAMEIAIRCRDRMAVHILAYGTAFEKCGPGNILMEKLLQASHADGIATYDLLAPGGGYKSDWADAAVDVNDHVIGISIAGVVFAKCWLGFARPLIKRTIEGLPHGLRCRVCRLFAIAA